MFDIGGIVGGPTLGILVDRRVVEIECLPRIQLLLYWFNFLLGKTAEPLSKFIGNDNMHVVVWCFNR